MIRFLKLLLIVFALFMSEAKAYEFKKINHLFDSIKTEFINTPNYRTMSLNSLKTLSLIDKDIKMFYNNNRAFLYDKNNLIMSFDLPQKTDCIAWKRLLGEVLDVSLQHSNTLQMHKDELETKILNICSQNIDKYSRIEKNVNYLASGHLEYNIENNILYVKSTLFFDGFASLLKDVIEENKNISGLILDLRKNKGGIFNEAIKTADLFLDDAIITYTSLKNNDKKYYTSTGGDILKGKKVIILISEQTASSAEIVTAALSEQGRAVTVGTQTYGKGSVQKMHNINNDTLYLTNSLIYSPSGKLIENNGIQPQICNGIENSCTISDKNNPNKDILVAINLIKNILG